MLTWFRRLFAQSAPPGRPPASPQSAEAPMIVVRGGTIRSMSGNTFNGTTMPEVDVQPGVVRVNGVIVWQGSGKPEVSIMANKVLVNGRQVA